MQKNDLVQWNGSLYRVLELQENHILLIDCIKRTMPSWYLLSKISQKAALTDMLTLQEETGHILEHFENASIQRQNVAHNRFSLIAGLISSISEALCEMVERLIGSGTTETEALYMVMKLLLEKGPSFVEFLDEDCPSALN